MLFDSNLIFDPAGSAITTTRVSTNILDMGVNRDMGIGDPLRLAAFTDGAFAGGTSINIQIQGAPDSSGSPGTFVTLAESGALTLTQLNANGVGTVVFPVALPAANALPGTVLPRFYRLNYVVVGTMTAGHIQASLNLGIFAAPTYPPGIVINA